MLPSLQADLRSTLQGVEAENRALVDKCKSAEVSGQSHRRGHPAPVPRLLRSVPHAQHMHWLVVQAALVRVACQRA